MLVTSCLDLLLSQKPPNQNSASRLQPPQVHRSAQLGQKQVQARGHKHPCHQPNQQQLVLLDPCSTWRRSSELAAWRLSGTSPTPPPARRPARVPGRETTAGRLRVQEERRLERSSGTTRT